METLQVFPTLERIVLGPFHGMADGAVAAGHHADEQIRHAVRGRYLGGIHNAQSAGRAGTGIENAASLGDPLHNPVHQFFDGRNGLGHGHGDQTVLLIDALQDFPGGHGVQVLEMRTLLCGFHTPTNKYAKLLKNLRICQFL